MSNKNNTSKLNVPAAKDAMEQFKQEAANEGVSLSQGDNGNLTSREAGSIGGQMVKNMTTARLAKKASFERVNRIADGHRITVRYIAEVVC